MTWDTPRCVTWLQTELKDVLSEQEAGELAEAFQRNKLCGRHFSYLGVWPSSLWSSIPFPGGLADQVALVIKRLLHCKECTNAEHF